MLTYPQINPVAFTVGNLKVHWYSLAYLAGFSIAWLLAKKRSRRIDLVVREHQVDDLIFYGALGVVLGARIGYVVFYGMTEFWADPMMIIRLWEGGLSFHGGLIGVVIAMMFYCRKIQQNFLDVMDFVAPFCPVGLFFGRVANFVNAELYGRAAEVPWAMVFPTDSEHQPRHPSQLYEAGLEGVLLFIVLFVWYSAKPRPRGAVCSLFVLLYGCFRFFIEFFRQPDAHISFEWFGWMSRGQELCLPMMIIGGGVFIWSQFNLPNKTIPLKAP